MKTKSLLIAFLLLITAAFAHARADGGSVVGNGAGLVENRFQYAYFSLQKVLMNCLINDDCGFTADEKALVQKVTQVLLLNMSNPKKFIFLPEAEILKVTAASMSEPHRVAMTGLTPQSPIYVNVNQLYDAQGAPQLDYDTILALIFHEVGHQAGEPNHQFLDLVGAKIRVKLESETLNYRFELNDGQKLEITMNNFSYPNKFAEIRMTRNNTELVNLGSMVARQLKCVEKNATVSGYEFFNGYFSPNFTRPQVTFNFIANVYCLKGQQSSLQAERKNIKFDITVDSKVEDLVVKGLP